MDAHGRIARAAIRCTAVALATACLGACQRTQWVEVDPSGCDREVVAQLNQPDTRHDEAAAAAMGAGLCAQHGKSAFAGAFRCSGHVMQVQCRA
jgi:hypothetical protein